MKRTLFGLAVLGLGALATTARAQHATAPDPVWYPGYVICGHLDLPNYDPAATTACGWSDPQQSAPIAFSRSSGYLAGWSFVAFNGAQPSSVVVSYTDAQNVTHGLAVTVYQGLDRPDVQAAYAGTFPNVTDHSGYAIYFNDPSALPLGTYVFHVQQFALSGTLQMADNFTLQVVE